MKPQPEKKRPGKKYNVHTCERHSDLTILFESAKKQICNTCFATLKKSYFNVIAGILLETHWLHNMIRRLVEENNRASQIFQHHQDIILKLQAEITEVKNNGKDHGDPGPKPPHCEVSVPAQAPDQTKETGASEISPDSHVSKARKELEQLHQARKSDSKTMKPEKNAEAYPKCDDLQDGSTNTAHNNTKSAGQIIEGIQHKEKH